MISVSYAYERYVRALQRSVRAPAEELRQLEAERLDLALQRAMAIIVVPSSSDVRALEAVDKVARLAEVRGRLLGFLRPRAARREASDVGPTGEVGCAITALLAQSTWLTAGPGWRR